MDTMSDKLMRFEPELTIYGAAATRQLLADALAQAMADGATLVLDLADVCEIDSAGLQLLMAARRDADARGISLALRDHSMVVRDTFALCGLDDQANGASHDA